MKIKMRVITDAEAEGTSQLKMTDERAVKGEPYFRGTGEGAGPIDMICGRCGHVLAAAIQSASVIASLVLWCTCCGAANAAPAVPLD